MTFLRLDRKCRDRPRIEPLQADRLARFLAIAIGAFVDPPECRVDLGNELALPVARTQFEGTLGLGGGAVGEIGMLRAVVLQMLQRFAILDEDVVLPLLELAAKILLLPFVHKRLVVGWHVALG